MEKFFATKLRPKLDANSLLPKIQLVPKIQMTPPITVPSLPVLKASHPDLTPPSKNTNDTAGIEGIPKPSDPFRSS